VEQTASGAKKKREEIKGKWKAFRLGVCHGVHGPCRAILTAPAGADNPGRRGLRNPAAETIV
jgi:hypothetical protein